MKYFEAKLDDYPINLLDITDTQPQSVVRHEFMFSDGAVTENYGLRAREVRFKVYYFGASQTADTATNYNVHYEFLNAITDNSKIHTFAHPKYGEMKGYISDTTVRHDDTQDYVEIDITFVESRLDMGGFLSPSAMTSIYAKQAAALEASMAKTNTIVNAITGLNGKIINFSQSLRSQIKNVTDPVRNFLTACDGFLGAIDSVADTITSPLITVNNAITFTQDIPGRLTSSVFNATNRIASTYVAIKSLPVNYINGINAGIANLFNSVQTLDADTAQMMNATIYAVGASTLSTQAMEIMQEDEINRQAAASAEKTKTFDPNGNRINSVQIPPVMSVQDIETILYNVRVFIQAAIDNDRDNQQLKDMAVLLVKYVDEIKLRKRSQVTMTVSSIPLHMLCMQIGLPYNAADRILKINPQIQNPTFVEGQVQVYVN